MDCGGAGFAITVAGGSGVAGSGDADGGPKAGSDGTPGGERLGTDAGAPGFAGSNSPDTAIPPGKTDCAMADAGVSIAIAATRNAVSMTPNSERYRDGGAPDQSRSPKGRGSASGGRLSPSSVEVGVESAGERPTGGPPALFPHPLHVLPAPVACFQAPGATRCMFTSAVAGARRPPRHHLPGPAAQARHLHLEPVC